MVAVATFLGRPPARTTAQHPPYAKIWPAFTMTYAIRGNDIGTDQVRLDQTHRLILTSEYAWRDEVIRDGIDPREVGSFRELKDGVITQYNAVRKDTQTFKLSSPEAVTSITVDLDPSLFARIRAGQAQGWQDARPSTTGRIAKMRTNTQPCRQSATCRVQERVEFDTTSINENSVAGQQTPVGGIAVSSEVLVDGKVERSFRAETLQIGR